jgi:hypothetical protein
VEKSIYIMGTMTIPFDTREILTERAALFEMVQSAIVTVASVLMARPPPY